MVVRVYSPTGEPFDVPRRDLADKLILQDGWTQTAPVVEEVYEPKPQKRRSRRKKSVEKTTAERDYGDE